MFEALQKVHGRDPAIHSRRPREYPRQFPADTCDTLGHHDAVLGEQTSDLVYERGALGDPKLPNTVETEHRLLFDGLDGHKAHVWPTHRLADGFGVILIILVVLAVRAHELGSNQPDVVSLLRERACPVMRA